MKAAHQSLFVVSLLLLSEANSANFRHKRQEEGCPIPYDWEWDIHQKDCSGKEEKYHCLLDEEGRKADGCFRPKECNRGARPVVEGSNLECRQCPTGTFQRQEGLQTDRQTISYCEDHNPCKAENGKKQCREGSATEDIGCECDAARGYFPRGGENCGCFSSESGCSCQIEECPVGSERNATGICVTPVVTTLDTSSSPVPPTPPFQASTNTPNSDFPGYGIVLLVLLIACILAGVFAVLWWKRRNAIYQCICQSSVAPSEPFGASFKTVKSDSVTLSWSPPSNDGGLPVKYYSLELTDDGGNSWRFIDKIQAVRTEYEARELQAGHTYKFRVSAVNSVGHSAPLTTAEVVPAGIPPPPEGPISFCNISDTCLDLRWQPPTSDGGAPLLGYIVKKRESGRNVWSDVSEVDAVTLTCKACELVEGMPYIFSVTARNEKGRSIPLESQEVLPKRPREVPSAPLGPIRFLRVLLDSVKLAWSTPANDGGTPIQFYTVEMSEDDGNSWYVMQPQVSPTWYTQEHLTKGKSYKFRVKAVNAVGQSDALVSECVEPTDLPSPPEGPLSVSQVTRDSAALTWKPSRSDGGSSLRGYLVEKREERRDVWTEVGKVDAETLSVKANGLIEGRAYFFRVTASNEKGSSSPLETTEAVTPKKPAVVPEMPVGPVKFSQVGAHSITLVWSPPMKNGGSPITSYTVEATDNDGETWRDVDAASVRGTFCEVQGLAETQNYKFRVYAVNAVGVSEPLVSRTVTTTKKKDERPMQIVHNHNPVVNITEAGTVIVADTYPPASAQRARQIRQDEPTILFGVQATDSHDVDETLVKIPNGSEPDPEETNCKSPLLPDGEETGRKVLHGEAGDNDEASHPVAAGEETPFISIHHQPERNHRTPETSC